MKKFIQGSSILLIGDLATKLLAFLYIIPLVRFDPTIATLIANLLIPFGFIVVIATMGINIVITDFVAKDYGVNEDRLKTNLISSMIIMIGLMIFAVVFVLLFAEYIVAIIETKDSIYYDHLVNGMIILTISVCLFSISTYLRSILMGMGDYKIVSISFITEQIIRIAIILYGFYRIIYLGGADIAAIIYIVCLAITISIITTIILFVGVFIKKKYFVLFTAGKFKNDRKIYKGIIIASAIFFASGIYITAFDQIDLLMMKQQLLDIGYSISEIDVIKYEYFSLSLKLVMIPIGISSSFITVMIRYMNKTKNEKKKEFNQILNISLIYSLLAVVGLLIIGSEIYFFMYQVESTMILTLQTLLIPFYIIKNIISGYIITNDGSYRSVIISMFIILGSKLVLNFALFSVFNVHGYILASLIALTLGITYLLVANRNLFLINKNIMNEKIIICIKFVFIFIVSVIISSTVYELFNVELLPIIINTIVVLLVFGIVYLKWIKRNVFTD